MISGTPGINTSVLFDAAASNSRGSLKTPGAAYILLEAAETQRIRACDSSFLYLCMRFSIRRALISVSCLSVSAISGVLLRAGKLHDAAS